MVFIRAIPKASNSVTDEAAPPEADDDDNDENEIDIDALLAAGPPAPTIDATHTPPGWYSHDHIDFNADAPIMIVGVDPGQGSPFTFFQEGMTHQEHVDAYNILKETWGDEYVLGPFGLTSTAYHNEIGTYKYNRYLDLAKNAHPIPDLTSISFKRGDADVVEQALQLQAPIQERVFWVYASRKVAKQKLISDGLKQRFFSRLHLSPSLRFPGRPVIAFGSANVRFLFCCCCGSRCLGCLLPLLLLLLVTH